MFDFVDPPETRTGFTMRISGVQLNRPDMENIATDLGVEFRDVLVKNGILTVYNTSKECQAIIDDNALVTFVALALEISPEDISELKEI
ncbi:MAG: hypothetical protein JKY28_06385 [Sulfurimonas sp.]|nr:hypothetical protein [Sulfurimonas sp.]PHQ91963.1 MAG: hypothetical protein COB42_02515 [Sulfurimonas sp.]